MKTLSFALLVLLLVSTAFSAPLYNLIDLYASRPPYSEYSFALSINNNGQIVGITIDYKSASNATLFDSTGNGNEIWLGRGVASSINNNGQIVGSSGYSEPRAILFDSTGGENNIDLGDISEAFSINNNGQIVGWAHDTRGRQHATLFDSSGNGNNIDLGFLTGGLQSNALSINDNGQIVGYSYKIATPEETYFEGYRATLFDITGAGNNIELGVLDKYSNSRAYSINNNGQIVGESYGDLLGSGHATLFDITGAGNNIDLGTLGGSSSWANSINNNGQIVGRARNALDVPRATLFDISGAGNNIDLNTLIDPSLGWILMGANSINDNGWIIGSGFNPDGHIRGYLLTPVPEPASAMLIGIGLIFVRLKRKHH